MTRLSRFAAIMATVATLPLMACSGTQIGGQMLSATPAQQAQIDAPLGQLKASKTAGPVWFEEALKYLGTKEQKGNGNSNNLIEKMHDLTKNAVGYSDATAWCASFVNYVLLTTTKKFGLPEHFAGTASSGARHFQVPENYAASKSDKKNPGWGTKVAVDDLHTGDVIAIIWDGTTKGHAGFVAATFVDEKGNVTGVWVLGGNQSNKAGTTETVNVALYMLDEADRIVFKRPTGYEVDPAHKAVALTKVEAQEVFGAHIGKRGSLKTSR